MRRRQRNIYDDPRQSGIRCRSRFPKNLDGIFIAAAIRQSHKPADLSSMYRRHIGMCAASPFNVALRGLFIEGIGADADRLA